MQYCIFLGGIWRACSRRLFSLNIASSTVHMMYFLVKYGVHAVRNVFCLNIASNSRYFLWEYRKCPVYEYGVQIFLFEIWHAKLDILPLASKMYYIFSYGQILGQRREKEKFVNKLSNFRP